MPVRQVWSPRVLSALRAMRGALSGIALAEKGGTYSHSIMTLQRHPLRRRCDVLRRPSYPAPVMTSSRDPFGGDLCGLRYSDIRRLIRLLTWSSSSTGRGQYRASRSKDRPRPRFVPAFEPRARRRHGGHTTTVTICLVSPRSVCGLARRWLTASARSESIGREA